jgi:hypothetical protein
MMMIESRQLNKKLEFWLLIKKEGEDKWGGTGRLGGEK